MYLCGNSVFDFLQIRILCKLEQSLHKSFSSRVCQVAVSPLFSQIHHSSTFLHATSFFHLFLSKTRSNIGTDGGKVRELSERRFEPRENIWKARTAQSSFVSASFERAAKIVCKICNFISWLSCNFAEINNLCAARNNDDGVKHSFSICSALGCVSFEPVLTLWDWLLGET